MPDRRAPLAIAIALLAPLGLAPARAGGPPAPASASASAADVAAKLQPPGSYGEGPVDWGAIPPWRQTSFFGVRSQGQIFVYVVDCSGSMAGDARLLRAKAELRRSINALRYPQRFLVIFYNDEPIVMPGHAPRSADGEARDAFASWLRHIEPDGETDPRAAMSMALNFRPDAVYLLSDGEFPDGTVEAVARMNRRKVPIHTIDLSGGAGDQLRQIAADSRGQYAARP